MKAMIDIIKSLLVQDGATVAVAESLTSGKLQNSFANVSGASKFFEGGITAYNLTQKVMLLGVEHFHAKEVNCVSSQVADEMSKGIAEKMQSDYGISTTGYAEPWPEGNIEQPKAYVSIYSRKDEQMVAKIFLQVMKTNDSQTLEITTDYGIGEKKVSEGVLKNVKQNYDRTLFRDCVVAETLCVFAAVLGDKFNKRNDD